MAERNLTMQDGVIIYPAMAAVKIEAGNLVCANASGYAATAADSANFTILGRAEETVDNSAGAAGDLKIKVRRLRAYWLANDATAPLTVADIGKKTACIKDSGTVQTAAGATNDIVVGKVLEIDSARGVLVYID